MKSANDTGSMNGHGLSVDLDGEMVSIALVHRDVDDDDADNCDDHDG